ncbi:hypothetical protein GQ457_08G000010 [Hibiscus cannabinus]
MAVVEWFQPVSNFKACGYAPQGDKLAQLDGFNNEVINGSKESMIWWSDEFDANQYCLPTVGELRLLLFNSMKCLKFRIRI